MTLVTCKQCSVEVSKRQAVVKHREYKDSRYYTPAPKVYYCSSDCFIDHENSSIWNGRFNKKEQAAEDALLGKEIK